MSRMRPVIAVFVVWIAGTVLKVVRVSHAQ
jgi:hypothetical protein